MNFTDRPNADRSFLLAVAKQREADREAHIQSSEAMRAEVAASTVRDLLPMTRAAAEAAAVKRQAHHQRVRDLYEQGKTDKEIGAALGISSSHACSIRNQLGLPTRFNRAEAARRLHAEGVIGRRLGAVGKEDIAAQLERLRVLHAEGLSDANIARALGVRQSSVRDARNALGLPRNIGVRLANKLAKAVGQ